MTIIDGLIWLYLLALPIYNYFTHQTEMQAIQSGNTTLSAIYWKTILLIWPGAILALLSNHMTIPIIASSNVSMLWALVILILLVGVVISGIVQVKNSQKIREQLIEKMESVSWLMPKTKKQLMLYLVGVCTTAGVAEEILYRGYLIPFLTQYMDQYLALVVASLIFALPHIYQGKAGILRTAIIGLGLAATVIIFDSLILAIACHFIIDAYSGYIAYISLKSKKSA
ncbi:hypothetical protein tinsulaeT_28450 [Thalassotalea insulae]|uniref:CAAX prenyl protease 2/Lysostaphin resistance protein A-like domain-containing protein n=1 Tax=Thalassotalea insulae TaxID=2056778 RepID=A0ABQ6GXM6_9GAMM|nr:CPBP family intramembrane glutamic endopeptidase [Thalassotalea insulae]GLX79505.1 hypothetical protein tinsulaeT_28450 [Thalassotalea insulae]